MMNIKGLQRLPEQGSLYIIMSTLEVWGSMCTAASPVLEQHPSGAARQIGSAE